MMRSFRILFRLLWAGLIVAGLFWASKHLDRLGSWEDKIQGQAEHSSMAYSGPVSSLGVGYRDTSAEGLMDSGEPTSAGFQKFLKNEIPTFGEMAAIRPEEAARMAAMAKQKSLEQSARVEEEIRKMEAGT